MSRPWEIWELSPSCYYAAYALRDCPDQQGYGARRVDPHQGEILLNEAPRLGSCALSFVDVETTGGSFARGHRIVELAVCRLEPNGEVKGPYERRVNPQRPIPWYASKIHGIYENHLRGAPSFRKIAPRLAAFCQGSVLVAHNGKQCDEPMLRGEFLWAEVAWPFVASIDTLPLSRLFWPGRSHKLVPLAESLGVPCGKAHSAKGDVQTLIGIWSKILEKVGANASLDDLSGRRGTP